MDNSIIAYNGTEIYQSDIDQLCDEYINSLPVPEMVYKTAVFNGLLDYIYKHLLKNIIKSDNGIRNNGYDFKLLDDIFYGLYLPLTYKFNKTATVLQFCVLCRMDNRNISDVKNGLYRSNGTKPNPVNTQTVQKWYSVCESALYDRAIEDNSIGAIFGLKANYGYRDNQTITLETQSQIPHETAEQIAAKHANAMLPEKPIFDD